MTLAATESHSSASRHEADPGLRERAGEQIEDLRILVAAGGTGGHIFPALAVAEELRLRWTTGSSDQGGKKGVDIQFLGTRRGLESRVIPAAGFALRVVSAAGLKGISGIKRLKNLMILPRTALETAQALSQFRPHVVVGMGAYLTGPVMVEAALAGIPTLLIEPNAVPGFTNRVLAPMVRIAALGFETAARYYGTNARITGHPVRQAFFAVRPRDHHPPFTVLVLGGSQGSVAVNQAVVACLPLLHQEAPGIQFVHQTGERDYNKVRQAYGDLGRDPGIEVHAFIDDVPAALERADLVVSRAGASAVAELAAARRAPILIPLPSAADNHQQANAEALERAGAARMILQPELTPERLAAAILELLRSPSQLLEMERAAGSLAHADAAARIADLIEELAGV